jgi:hypothetical protein
MKETVWELSALTGEVFSKRKQYLKNSWKVLEEKVKQVSGVM